MKSLSIIALALPALALATTTNLSPGVGNLATSLTSAKAGDTILLAAGTYSITYKASTANTITLSQSGTQGAPIVLRSEGFAKATIDFQFPDTLWVQDSYGLYVTGSWWRIEGIAITRAGYQGAYVTGLHNTFVNCSFHHNRNSGLELNKGGGYTTVIRCDSYRNYDPKKKGSMADGFASKQTQGPGNTFSQCRAWENGDDGFDTYDSPDSVIIEDSWVIRNGVDVWGYGGFAGNGNGFKVGGNYKFQRNHLLRCIAIGHPNKGFDQNNNTAGITIWNSLAYGNGTNFGLGGSLDSNSKHDLRNNISFNGTNSITAANAVQSHNSWNLSITPKTSDFTSIDTSLALAARNADGSLPDNGLFRLVKGCSMVDAGEKLGMAYSGSAPDLGPFELVADPTTGIAIRKAMVPAYSAEKMLYRLDGRRVRQ